MKSLFTFIVLLCTLNVSYATESYLVLHWNEDTRIILSKSPCLVPNKKGSAAVVQKLRSTGRVDYIKGCWNYEVSNKDLVRIDWEPTRYSNGKEDFAVLELARFKYVEQ